MPIRPEGLKFPLNSSEYHVEAIHTMLQSVLKRARAFTQFDMIVAQAPIYAS